MFEFSCQKSVFSNIMTRLFFCILLNLCTNADKIFKQILILDSHTSDIADRNEAILTSVSKSEDSDMDKMEEKPESKRENEDL